MSTFVQYMYCAQCVIVWMSPPPLLEMGHICFFRMGVVSVLFPKCWGGGGILLGGRGEIKPENLEVWWPYATLLYIYFSVTIQTFIQSYAHNIRWGPSPYLHISAGSVGGTSMGCRAEIRTRTCLTATQRTLLLILQRRGTRTLRSGSSLTTWPTPPPWGAGATRPSSSYPPPPTSSPGCPARYPVQSRYGGGEIFEFFSTLFNTA